MSVKWNSFFHKFVFSKPSNSMRRTCLIMLLMCLSITMMAQREWTVKTVPNTRLQSNDIHVSAPDDFLSDSIEMTINTALCAIRDKADVFLVTLASIGDAEPKPFATELLNYWGIGDKNTDNGVLLLFVEDQHALEFETGYGTEEILTDARCQQIFTKTIVPFFRNGDYEGGLCAGVADIVEMYNGEIPAGLTTTLPSNYDSNGSDESDDFSTLFMVFALVMFAMPCVGFFYWLSKRKKETRLDSELYQSSEESGTTYIDYSKTAWSGSPWEGKGCLGALTLGFSIYVIVFIVIIFMPFRFYGLEEENHLDWVAGVTLFLYLTWVCFRQNHLVLKKADTLAKQLIKPKEIYETAFKHTANKIAMWMAPWLGVVYYKILKSRIEHSSEFQCPTCGQSMSRHGGFQLPESHECETKIKALKFTPYRCQNGHEFVMKEKGSLYDEYQTCSKCGAYTLKLTKSETLVKADYSHDGKKEEVYECQHCGNTLTKTVLIPKLVHYSSSSSGSSYSSSSSRSYSSHSSSHSSGGSFGGGRSGGGGYSGRW